MDFREVAVKMINEGLVPVPLRKDSKVAAIKWTPFQTRFPTPEEVDKNFRDCGGISALTMPGRGEGDLISNLFCLDFDLKYQLPTQDFFKAFGEQIPKEIKQRFLINQTGSGYGRHIWFKAEGFFDKSRKLAYRLKTPEEIIEDKKEMLSQGIDEQKANVNLMKNPYKVVIESRGFNSYGVFMHPEYKRIYGKKLYTFNKEECELIMDAAYATSEYFVKKKKHSGNVDAYKTILKFNEDTSADDIMNLLSSTGMLSYVDTDRSGNIKFKRQGSPIHSGIIFADSAVTHIFSNNTILGNNGAYSPFEIYCTVNNITQYEAIKQLNNK
jgi:hypothetical protein